MCTSYARDMCFETIENLAFVMEVYSSNIPGICQFLEYTRYNIPGIFQTYDSDYADSRCSSGMTPEQRNHMLGAVWSSSLSEFCVRSEKRCGK